MLAASLTLTEAGKTVHNVAVAYPFFPELSRAFALKTQEQTVDPTLRDPLENGMEQTMLQWTRRRRTFSISIDHLTPGDKDLLDNFVLNVAKYGALPFQVLDNRDLFAGQIYLVRFADNGLPKYSDDGMVLGEYRQNCTFMIREM